MLTSELNRVVFRTGLRSYLFNGVTAQEGVVCVVIDNLLNHTEMCFCYSLLILIYGLCT